MIKKTVIIIILVVLFALIGIGIYLFLTKKSPVSRQAPPTQQLYTNPVFGYTLIIPVGYEILPQKTGDISCLTLKNSNKCIIIFVAYANTTKETLDYFIQNLPSNFKSFKVNKTQIGNYDVATWEDTSLHYVFQNQDIVLSLNYLFLNQDVVLRISVDKPDLQLANQIMATIKFK